MDDHHPPPAHRPPAKPNKPTKPRKLEHDLNVEEDIPTDAPDVDGQQMIHDLERKDAVVKHPHSPPGA